MRAYVINLERSPDRRAHITAELKKTGLEYEIVTAVDGRDLDLHDTAFIDPSLPSKSHLPAGTAGCALSHLRVYRKIIEDGLNKALVVEDDVNLPADLESLANDVADQMSAAEVALLSYDSRTACKMSYEGSIKLQSSRVLALPIDIRQLLSSAAYIITKAACQRMIDFVLPVRSSADDWWFFYREGVLDRVQCVVPLPVLKNPNFTSTIGSYSLGNGVMARLAWSLVRREIPLLHQALRYRRRGIYRQWGQSELVDEPFIEKPSRLG